MFLSCGGDLPATVSTESSMCAALQALIAYTHGQESSRVQVSSESGRIVLSGEVDSLQAFEHAVIIAECFASRPIIADLAIRSPVRRTLERRAHDQNLIEV